MDLYRTLRYPKQYFKYDLTAGVVVFLVAIPLCLGVALASGAPLLSGIISGIIGGIIVGMISESAVSVSGPAAGMVAVVLAAITQLGSFEVFLLALFFAGALQIITGTLRAGFIADYIPSNIIQGLLCAIGILIVIKQLPFALTYTSESKELLNSLSEVSQNFNLIPLEDIWSHINLGAVIISIVSIFLLIYFDQTKRKFLKSIPGPVAVVIAGALINEIYNYQFQDLLQLDTELVNLPVAGSGAGFISQLQFPAWSAWSNINVYIYAFILAAVASLEALLNLEAVEKLDKARRYCSRNRELVAQGIGNICSGLIGGLPITSVVVRSSVNIQAGSKTKLATIIHGLLILLIVLFLPSLINRIPLASLAAILIYVGCKLAHPKIFVKIYHQGMARFIPFVITVLAIIFTNLLAGILIGLFLGLFFILRENSQIQLDIIREKHPFGLVKRIVLPQHMSFLRKASLVSELDSIEPGSNLIIDARYTKYIDLDILEILDVFRKMQAPYKKISINMLGFKRKYELHDQVEFLNVTTYDTQSSLVPINVLEILKEGNKRFIEGKAINRSLLDDIKATSTNQHPIAIVLGCIDSRVPIETIFDMGVGDVFVVRVAGNVVNDDILASMEFACNISGAKLILVLGHTYCGAIKAACGETPDGFLGKLLAKIKPAVNYVSARLKIPHNHEHHDAKFLSEVTKVNVENTKKQIYNESQSLKALINNHSLGLIGAVYDIETGKVKFEEKFYSGGSN